MRLVPLSQTDTIQLHHGDLVVTATITRYLTRPAREHCAWSCHGHSGLTTTYTEAIGAIMFAAAGECSPDCTTHHGHVPF